MLEYSGLCERTFRAEESDLQRFLLSKARRHDLAEQPQDFLVSKRAIIAIQYGLRTSASRSGR